MGRGLALFPHPQLSLLVVAMALLFLTYCLCCSMFYLLIANYDCSAVACLLASFPGPNEPSHTLPGKALNTYSEALSRIMVAPNSSHGCVYKDSTITEVALGQLDSVGAQTTSSYYQLSHGGQLLRSSVCQGLANSIMAHQCQRDQLCHGMRLHVFGLDTPSLPITVPSMHARSFCVQTM